MSAVHCGAQLWSTLIMNIIICFLLPHGMLSSKKMANTLPSLRCFGGLRSSGKGPVKVRFSENPSNVRVDYITKQLIHGSLCNIRLAKNRALGLRPRALFLATRPGARVYKLDVTRQPMN